MREAALTPIERKNYSAPAYWISEVNLTFDLDATKTRVLNRMRVRPNPDVAQPQALRLDGEELDLVRVLINGQGVTFCIEENERGHQLVIEQVPDEEFELEVFTICKPEKNTSCQGLYVSQDAFFTQCEAESFRRITYFLDRPDVMAEYTVTLRADKQRYPVLLSNGNLLDQGDLPEGRHYAVWHDPFPKPSYLFALVAGNFICREQRIKTSAGKSHLLQVYVRAGDLDKTEHTMNSLINAIAWDEARFGLLLDLNRYMIVAVSDYNMGAMENKGLNIFNTKYVLANPATATDADFFNIESVVGHEYFHNWTGNRVTCRDWFQLTLKEGLTVFRDQEFSMDMAGTASAKAIKRIEDVRTLRSVQFPEDAGPMAHPIRPDAYVQIDNFYTATVYEKGAEVIRMMQTLVSREGFAKGLSLYFERFDGQAVTCDDFAQAIADANPASALAKHLPQFKRWYSQAGTPHVKASGWYDDESHTYKLTLSQTCAPSVGQSEKAPFVIPVNMGLISAADGGEMPLQFAGEPVGQDGSRVLTLIEPEQSWTFVNLDTEPVPSLLRGFSAPAVLDLQMHDSHWLALLKHDTDPFNRWEAAQRLALDRLIKPVKTGGPVELDTPFIEALRAVLRDEKLDAGFKELVLTLPSETYIAEQFNAVDPQRIHEVREAMLQQMAQTLYGDWIAVWNTLAQAQNRTQGGYQLNHEAAGRRALANMALACVCRAAAQEGTEVWEGKAYQRFKDADNMTDKLGALRALLASRSKLVQPAMERFFNQYQHEALVIDKWFTLQATASDNDGHVLPQVRTLLKHPAFSISNPNRVRSLISSFCQANPAGFHRADGQGYTFWVEQVTALNKINAQVAARLARALDNWRKLAEPYQSKAQQALQQVAAQTGLSTEVKEIITRALGPHQSKENNAVKAPVTLMQYLLEQQRQSHIPAELSTLLLSITQTCQRISAAVRQGALAGVLGAAGTENVQGEEQKKLDVISNDMMITGCCSAGVLAGMASEEMKDILPISAVDASAPQGNYLILFDPLDGSSNIDVNVSIGTIFSVLKRTGTGEVSEAEFLQPGRNQIAAGYCLYGPQTTLMLTLGKGVVMFTLDSAVGEFVLTRSHVTVAQDTQEFAINMSNMRHWAEPVRRYIQECLDGADGVRGKNFNMRWVASMVAEVHRILSRGGIFMYPWDKREPEKPGKLRLMYEANPMGFLIEQAGGKATNGKERILDIQPQKLHQRVPVILGAKNEVEQVSSYHS